MSPQTSLRLTFDWFKVFYANKKDRKKYIKSKESA